MLIIVSILLAAHHGSSNLSELAFRVSTRLAEGMEHDTDHVGKEHHLGRWIEGSNGLDVSANALGPPPKPGAQSGP